MRLFVSVPTRGHSDAAVEAIKQAALKRVRETLEPSAELVDSYVAEDAPEDVDGERIGIWYLGESLKRLAQSEAAFFAEGWQTARGCRIERAVCEAYERPSILDTPMLDRWAARQAEAQWRLNESGVNVCPEATRNKEEMPK